MLGRRHMVGGGLALGAALLTGCGVRGRRLEKTVNDAAQSVDGVTASSLETATGAEFHRSLHGQVETSGAQREETLAIFEDVMSTLAATADPTGDGPPEGTRIVGGITALSSSGEEFGIWDLRPDLERSRGRLDDVILSDFAG